MCIQIYNNYKERKNDICFCQIKYKMNFLMIFKLFLMIDFIKSWDVLMIF